MDDPDRPDRSTRPNRWLALVGVIGGASAASVMAATPAAPAPSALEGRVAAARHQLRSVTTRPPWVLSIAASSTSAASLEPDSSVGPVAAWNNWPNWSNWANWANG